ncbi:hypothetical protein [Methylobacter sp. YRD-M1]|uniref:hypothetical protein n=1 Tax=Methylobacter sp. YRD-M1 TaxID=2911520 RepID=UPI00227BE4C7|nr:hypothetical protein [Methylobacter sp. YRD-M1]WAK00439.1 hypothetical protein LZ558_11290 [Methylobacter sp. YRD-M1]
MIMTTSRPAAAGDGVPIINNGSFESFRDAKPGADGLVTGWKLDAAGQIPSDWQLNPAYPGQLMAGTDDPQAGSRFVRIKASGRGAAHIYQRCQGLRAGKWYRVSLWVRGGAFAVQTYEYFRERPTENQMMLQERAGAKWQQYSVFYQPAGAGYLDSALVISTASQSGVNIDDVRVEPADLPELPADATDMVFQNETVQMRLSPAGFLTHFISLDSSEDYAAINARRPMLTVSRAGIQGMPVTRLSQKGDVLTAQFVDPQIKVSLRVIPAKRHLTFEVLSAEPADLDGLTIDFPLRRLETVAPAFNATYDKEFGAALFGITENTVNHPVSLGNSVHLLRSEAYRSHGIVGAKFSLVASPIEDFKPAIREAERAAGLPSPELGGNWARDSESVQESYLFATDASEANIDALIDYAKLGGFGTIVFLKNNWLDSHGHYRINTGNFPHGLEGLKAAVAKIHAAGLEAGVHVFGPSISPNDSYITPKPDDRLATVPVPDLAEALDAKATTIKLSAEPRLPPIGPSREEFPGKYLRVGDEIIRYGTAEPGPPFRYIHCVRGALGTKAEAHPVGSTVRGLLTMWGYFLVDPDSTLVDELTRNFADVFNSADFDMVYFDASDGIIDDYIDSWYYLNRMHLAYYHKFRKDVLYQTSNGVGTDLWWHIVPRSASADGHGDIKGYLDERWPGILRMDANFTRPDIGWYYWFKDIRPDQLEYVAAKALAVDGSISLETSRAALESQTQSRQMMDTLRKWEQYRRTQPVSQEIKAKLREPQKDFKLFSDADGDWQLYRASYEPVRYVDVLDGKQNTWMIRNDTASERQLGVEIIAGRMPGASAAYSSPEALMIESFENAADFQISDHNQYEKHVARADKVLSFSGPVRDGVRQSFETVRSGIETGRNALLYTATNNGKYGGWSAIGRRFDKPLNLSGNNALGVWVMGDAKYEQLHIQLRDSNGRSADFQAAIDFTGWHLLTFLFPTDSQFDWANTEYLLFHFDAMPAKTTVSVALDSVRAFRTPASIPSLDRPIITVNGESMVFPESLAAGQALTSEGPSKTIHWPGGMAPGKKVEPSSLRLKLKPGTNAVTFSSAKPDAFPGNIRVLLYQVWPVEE